MYPLKYYNLPTSQYRLLMYHNPKLLKNLHHRMENQISLGRQQHVKKIGPIINLHFFDRRQLIMAANPNPSVGQLIDCPMDFDKIVNFPLWTDVSSFSPATARTLKWMFRGVDYIETKCQNKAYVKQFKKTPLFIGESIANGRLR